MMFLRESLHRRKRGELGFSFIELVIVVAVIGILTSIAIPSYGAIQSNAKQAAVDSNAQIGYRLVAATMAGFDGASSATTSGKAVKTPQQTLDSLKNDDISLAFLDKNGLVITNPSEDFCVYAFNTKENFGDKYRYTSLVGECPTVTPNRPGVVAPAPEPTPQPSTPTNPTPDPSPAPTEDPRIVAPQRTMSPKPSYGEEPARSTLTYNMSTTMGKLTSDGESLFVVTGATAGNGVVVKHDTTGLTADERVSPAHTNLRDYHIHGGYAYYANNTMLVRENLSTGAKDEVASGTINTMEITKRGDVYVAVGQKIFQLDFSTNSRTEIADYPQTGIVALAAGNEALYFSNREGVTKYDPLTKKVTRMGSGGYTDLVYTTEGLLGSVGNVIYKISENGTRTIFKNLSYNGAAYSISSFTFTANGDLWVRGVGNGNHLLKYS